MTVQSAFDRANTRFVGDSDSGLLLCHKAIRSVFPDARWLLVRRDVKDAVMSFKAYFSGRTYAGVKVDDLDLSRAEALEAELTALEQSLPENQKMVVPYDELDYKLVLHEVWNFLTPGNPWSDNRWDLLNTMQINIYPEKVRSKWVSQKLQQP